MGNLHKQVAEFTKGFIYCAIIVIITPNQKYIFVYRILIYTTMTKLETLSIGINKSSHKTAQASHHQDESRNSQVDLTTTMRIVFDGK